MICPVVVCSLHLGCILGAAWMLAVTTNLEVQGSVLRGQEQKAASM